MGAPWIGRQGIGRARTAREVRNLLRIILNGALGAMGQVIAGMAGERGEEFSVVAGVDAHGEEGAAAYPLFADFAVCQVPCDVIVDFSVPDALPGVIAAAKERGCALVVATTGLTEGHMAMLAEAGRAIPVFQASNMSLGVNLQIDLVKQAANVLGDAFDIEIVEKHHNRKVDAPSGTALTLANELAEEFPEGKGFTYERHSRRQRRRREEIGLHSVRGGTVSGEHQVLFLGEDEVLEVTHIAQSKRIFAAGALRAARFVAGQEPGLYTMNQLLAEENSVTKIAAVNAQSMISLGHISHIRGEMADVFDAVAHINIDMISQSMPDGEGNIDVSFTLPTTDLPSALKALSTYSGVASRSELARLTIEGPGMEHQSGVAAGVFRALVDAKVAIFLVTTSETKISFCIQENELEPALQAAKGAFDLL